jgi:hypothetical protein
MEANNKRGDIRERIITFRLTDPEIKELDCLKEKYGLTRSDLIRKFLLEEKGPLIVNLREFLEGMSELAAEQGRVNNNINQLARHANQSLRPNQTNPLLFARFNELMGKYLEYQRLMSGCFKKIYRSIAS